MLTLFDIISLIFTLFHSFGEKPPAVLFQGPHAPNFYPFEHFQDCDIQNALHNAGLKNKTSCSLKIE